MDRPVADQPEPRPEPQSAETQVWTPPPWPATVADNDSTKPTKLTLRDVVDSIGDGSMVWPLVFRDAEGRLHDVADLTVAPRRGLIILEATALP
jgi:hypothetical protein